MTGIGSMLCLMVIATVLTEVAATDYCNIKHCPPETHTMCKYKSDGPAAACGKVLKVGCTNDDKNVILTLHNELRQRVALGLVPPLPPADFMPYLVWDEELAYIAQRWTNQCERGHDDCFNVVRFDVRQNWAWYEKKEDDIKLEDLIQIWFEGEMYLNPKEVSKYTGENFDEADPYIQLIWASTIKVGCGCIKFKKHDGWIATHLMCNYGPSGNVIGEPIYEIKT